MAENIESHAFGTFAPPNAEILIIGTFPTHKRNRAFEFFYPNKQNVFWKLMEHIYSLKFHHTIGEQAVEERKAFAAQHKIALTDMLAKAIRIENSSSDNQLIPVELMDILSILKVNPTIQKIVLTSRSGKNSALELFKCHLVINKTPFFETTLNNVIKGYFDYQGIKYEVVVPYSPSPRVERQKGFDVLLKMYIMALSINIK